ncbi:MAG: DUF3603 family protein [Sporolactobacillus sp.]
MEVMSDVWVNWFEGEENGYNVCSFPEWRKHDLIELLDQVPLVKISSQLFDYIENNLKELPEQLLKDVRNRSVICKNNQRQIIEYCFIATDGQSALAVDTLGYRVPVRKSRLVPRQEEAALAAAGQAKCTDYPDPAPARKAYHLLSPDPRLMVGLTRRERQMKQLLFMALDQLHAHGSVEELRYWYTEWFPTRYEESRRLSSEAAWQAIAGDIVNGWSARHADVCERLIKGQPYFEQLWEAEHPSKVQ